MPQSTRGLRRITSRSRIRFLPALLGVLALGACDAASPSGPEVPEPDVPANLAPVVQSVSVADDGYRKARLRGSVSDPEGDIASAVIDWGDGKTTNVTGSFSNISVQHRYDRAQDFTVTLTVTDGEGVSSERSSSISIQVPDPACLDLLKIVGACINVTKDLRNFELEVRVFNKVVYSEEIKDGKGDVRIPFGAGFGAMVVAFDMERGRLTVTGEYCIIPFLKCESFGSHTIQLKT